MPWLKRKKKQTVDEKAELAKKFDMLQASVEQLAKKKKQSSSSNSAAYPLKRSETKEDLKKRMKALEDQMMDQAETMEVQNAVIKQQNQSLEAQLSKIETDNTNKSLADGGFTQDEMDDEVSLAELYQGDFIVGHGPTNWRVSGYASAIPVADFQYFMGLRVEPTKISAVKYNYDQEKVLSIFVSCHSESGKDLDRTLVSLSQQRLPEGWRVEVIIVVDGSDTIGPTLAERLQKMFGVAFNTKDQNDPFVKLPNAKVIIVDPVDENNALSRAPAMKGTVGGYTLLVKKQNRRKKNSHMWWLGSHAASLNCKYAMSVDCGTAFARTATIHLIRRLHGDPDMDAVYGTHRTMTSYMQSDGRFEIFSNPFSYMLRMLQRLESEVQSATTKPICDTLGRMDTSCGMFRCSALGDWSSGVLQEYFSMFQGTAQQGFTKGLVSGNVELSEDQVLGTLLSYPGGERVSEDTGPRTGFVPDAIFYTEAEKPLSRYIVQRRRRENGSLAKNIWMLNEGIVTGAAMDSFSKLASWTFMFANIFRTSVVRLFGPALLIVAMFRFGLFLPSIIKDPKTLLDEKLNVTSTDINEGDVVSGLVCGSLYAAVFVAFVVSHCPQGNDFKRTKGGVPSDRKAVRGLVKPIVVIHAVMTVIFLVNTVSIFITSGWSETPVYIKVTAILALLPLVIVALDGLIRRDLRCFFGMLMSLPGAIPLLLFSSIWLPLYFSARMSDLTWGNRVGGGVLELSSSLLKRIKSGRQLAKSLVFFNLIVACAVIVSMNYFEDSFSIFFVAFISALAVPSLLSCIDLIYRFLTCHYCFNTVAEEDLMKEDENDPHEILHCVDGYRELESEIAGARLAKNDRSTGSDTDETFDSDYVRMEKNESAIHMRNVQSATSATRLVENENMLRNVSVGGGNNFDKRVISLQPLSAARTSSAFDSERNNFERRVASLQAPPTSAGFDEGRNIGGYVPPPSDAEAPSSPPVEVPYTQDTTKENMDRVRTL